MSNVVPFAPKSDIVAPEKAPLVGASGEAVKTARSVQNEILQRRNFVLIDCATGEMVFNSNNPMQAYAAVSSCMTNLLFNSVHVLSSKTAIDVFKRIAEEEMKPQQEAAVANTDKVNGDTETVDAPPTA